MALAGTAWKAIRLTRSCLVHRELRTNHNTEAKEEVPSAPELEVQAPLLGSIQSPNVVHPLHECNLCMACMFVLQVCISAANEGGWEQGELL